MTAFPSSTSFARSAWRHCLHCCVQWRTATPLAVHSGEGGIIADGCLAALPNGAVVISGMAQANLLRRALLRLDPQQHPHAARLAQAISGDMGFLNKGENHDSPLSPLWCDDAYLKEKAREYRHGNQINPATGVVQEGHLWVDELLPPGVNWCSQWKLFCRPDHSAAIQEDLAAALAVIHYGGEVLGGDGNYGCGRLAVTTFDIQTLDLERQTVCSSLTRDAASPLPAPAIDPDRGWLHIEVDCRIAPGQLLAIHGGHLDLRTDHPLYVRPALDGSHEIVLPGRSLRQALLKAPMRRQSETLAEAWFGSTDQAGAIRVEDAIVRYQHAPIILHRIQLSETTFANVNLFDGEYLRDGRWTVHIMLDSQRLRLARVSPEADFHALQKAVVAQLQAWGWQSKGPPGWIRLGATTAATGAIQAQAVRATPFGLGREHCASAWEIE